MSRNNTNHGVDMNPLTRLASFAAGMLLAGSAAAIEFDMAGATVTFTTKASMGAAMRMEERNPDLVGIANGGNAFSTNTDDGNLAFDKGDLVSGAAKLTSDLAIGMGEFGVFLRASALGNPVLQDAELFDPADYGANKEFGQDERIRKENEVRNHVGSDFDLLDAYVFGRFEVLDRGLNIKVGRQVLNWGESVFVQHGLNALITADVNQLRVPGFEIEEVQVPVGMAVISLDLIENVAVEGFYQYEWQSTTIDAAGTYWSTNDFAGIGGTQANLGFGRAGENSPATTANPATWCLPPPSPFAPVFSGTPCNPFGSTVPRAPNREPGHDGQYGAKLSFYVPWLNDMDLAFYGANYHSRLPVSSGTSRTGPASPADDANYFLEYPENIQLYGTSFNTTVALLDIAVQGEYSYKVDQPLQLDDVELLLAGLGAAGQISPTAGGTLNRQYIRGWRRHDVSQVDLSFTKVFSPTFGYDQLSMFVEAGYVYVHDLPAPETLAYDAPATSTMNAGTRSLNPATANGLPTVPYDAYATDESWGYKAALRFTYNDFLGMTFEPTFLFQHDVEGTTPGPIVNFVEDRRQLNTILSFNYLQTWGVDVGYAFYFGAGNRNLIEDRDYADIAIKYSF